MEYNPHIACVTNWQRFWVEQASKTSNLLRELEKKYKIAVSKGCN